MENSVVCGGVVLAFFAAVAIARFLVSARNERRLAALAPLIAGTVWRQWQPDGKQPGLGGRYREFTVGATLCPYSGREWWFELTLGPPPLKAFRRSPGGEAWRITYRTIPPERVPQLRPWAEPTLLQRLADAGVEAILRGWVRSWPTEFAELEYGPREHTLIYRTARGIPSPAEFRAQLDLLARLMAINWLVNGGRPEEWHPPDPADRAAD